MSLPAPKPAAPKSPGPVSSTAKPTDISPSDLLDRTMELDIRGLMYDDDDSEKPADPRSIRDDPTVVLDLTATQVHELLSVKKK
jgi:hypothetical protein